MWQFRISMHPQELIDGHLDCPALFPCHQLLYYWCLREKLSKSFEKSSELVLTLCKYLFFLLIYQSHSYIQRIYSASETSTTELTNRKNLSPAIMMEMGIWVSWVTYWTDVQQGCLFSSSLVVFYNCYVQATAQFSS